MITAPWRYLFESGEETRGIVSETRSILLDNRLECLADPALVNELGITPALEARIIDLLPDQGDASYATRMTMGWTAEECRQVQALLQEASRTLIHVVSRARTKNETEKAACLVDLWAPRFL